MTRDLWAAITWCFCLVLAACAAFLVSGIATVMLFGLYRLLGGE